MGPSVAHRAVPAGHAADLPAPANYSPTTAVALVAVADPTLADRPAAVGSAAVGPVALHLAVPRRIVFAPVAFRRAVAGSARFAAAVVAYSLVAFPALRLPRDFVPVAFDLALVGLSAIDPSRILLVCLPAAVARLAALAATTVDLDSARAPSIAAGLVGAHLAIGQSSSDPASALRFDPAFDLA